MRCADHITYSQRHTIWTAAAIIVVGLLGGIVLASTSAVVPECGFSDWWLNALKDVGFPMAVAGFLLIRVERTLSEIRNALVDLKELHERKP